MKVLLCSQYYGDEGLVFPAGICFPLGLAYIASMLKEHDVRVFDANIAKNPRGELSELLSSHEPDVVGISLRNIDLLNPPRTGVSFYEHFKTMLRLIRKKAPSSKIIVGGTAFSVFSEQIMARNKEIDFGVVSDGETTIANLLRNFDNPKKVKNLLLQSEKGVEFTGRGELADFDLLPFPSRELFDLTKYIEEPFSMNVQSKRGCGFKCLYCAEPFLGRYTIQLRSAKKVVDEIEELVNNYGVKSFWFADSIFNFPLEHARDICREISRRKIEVEWLAYFREDFLNLRFAKEAVDAGCRSFEFHTDGTCDQTLAVLNKGIKISEIERTIDIARRIENAKVGYNLFYDLPRGNVRNLIALARFTVKATLKCRQKLAYLAFTRMRIYPHTLLYEIALREGKIGKDTDLLRPVFYEAAFSKIQDVCMLGLEKLSSFLLKSFK